MKKKKKVFYLGQVDFTSDMQVCLFQHMKINQFNSSHSIKDRNHTIILIDIEKVFDKNPFIIKALEGLGLF